MFLLYAIIPVVILTFIILLIFLGALQYSLEKTNKEDNKRITRDVETTVNSYIELINKLANEKYIKDGEIDVNTRVKIFEDIYKISNSLDRKANFYLFDEKITPIICGTKSVPSFLEGKNINWGIFRIIHNNKNQITLKIVEEANSEGMKLVIGKEIVEGDVTKGYLVFVLDSKQFESEIANMHSQTVITDEYRRIYVSNNKSFLDSMNRFDLNGQNMNGKVMNNQVKYYITSNHILNNHIHIYSISNISNQTSPFKFIGIVLLGVFLMMIFMVTFSTKIMAKKKTKSLYMIINALERVNEGDLNSYIKIEMNDEFKIIADSYNIMLDSLRKQIERNKEMGILVDVSQARQLESQFNPHFLYNTLENIRFMCKLDPDSASDMVVSLSTLLRYSISKKSEEVMVKEDVMYTENYMSILKYRFNQRFHYEINIPEEVEKCIIPKLILQPMIENAIKYGFEGKDQLTVEIRGFIVKEKLVLICLDNGAGMERKVLEELKHILDQQTNQSNHSGLYNIHRRIQLKYGDQYGVSIQSKLGNGTVLRVELPVKYEDNNGGA